MFFCPSLLESLVDEKLYTDMAFTSIKCLSPGSVN